MNKHTYGEIEYLTFDSLDKLGCVRNVFTTRSGGVSEGYHASMNLSFTNGDKPENILRNFDIISEVLEVSPDHIVRSHQTHTTNVLKVTADMVYEDGILHNPPRTDTDGLITDVKGIALATFYADCVPLYFADPVKKVIGLSHSGWRGTVAGMAAKTVQAMCDTYGCDPRDIHAAIGPSICKNCYEVDNAVAEPVIEAFGSRHQDVLYPGKAPGKYQLDLWEANKLFMLDAGILEENIEISGLCTCENSDHLFSHRASGGKRGNLAAFLMLI
jgi:YfiH family protein